MGKQKTSATDTAVKYLYTGDKSEYEVRNNLKNKEYTNDEIEEAIRFLKDYSYIDDAKYCIHYIRIQCEKGKGLRRIKEELRFKKRIDSELINQAMMNLEDEGYDFSDESEMAMDIAYRITEGKVITDKLIEKTARRLSYLGYGSSDIMKVMNKLRRQMNNYDDEWI